LQRLEEFGSTVNLPTPERRHHGVVVVPVILGADKSRFKVGKDSLKTLELLLVLKRLFGGNASEIINRWPKTGFINKLGVAAKAF
jgi:hypothetical protein